jgi:hypothetical protein
MALKPPIITIAEVIMGNKCMMSTSSASPRQTTLNVSRITPVTETPATGATTAAATAMLSLRVPIYHCDIPSDDLYSKINNPGEAVLEQNRKLFVPDWRHSVKPKELILYTTHSDYLEDDLIRDRVKGVANTFEWSRHYYFTSLPAAWLYYHLVVRLGVREGVAKQTAFDKVIQPNRFESQAWKAAVSIRNSFITSILELKKFAQFPRSCPTPPLWITKPPDPIVAESKTATRVTEAIKDPVRAHIMTLTPNKRRRRNNSVHASAILLSTKPTPTPAVNPPVLLLPLPASSRSPIQNQNESGDCQTI